MLSASLTSRALGVPHVLARWDGLGQLHSEGPGAYAQASLESSHLFYRGDIFSLPGDSPLSPDDPTAATKVLRYLLGGGSWDEIDGQFSAIWVKFDSIVAFRSAFSSYLLYFDHRGVSDRIALLANKETGYSFDYLQKFVLDYPSLQFSSELTPFENVYRLTSCAEVEISRMGSIRRKSFPFQQYGLVEQGARRKEDIVEGVKSTLRDVLQWNIDKGKPVFAELSGGLDSSYVCSQLADLTQSPFRAHMYAYRKHPSHSYSERCAQTVAREKNIALTIVDSADIARPDLSRALPYQDEPIDFYWQGVLFGNICQGLVPDNSLLFTGFGCDQLFMRGHEILTSLHKKREFGALVSLLTDVARSSNRSTFNFFVQFAISTIPRPLLARILDSTRSLRINPFRIEELLPEISRCERVEWLRSPKHKNPSTWLWELNAEGARQEDRFFDPSLPHSNLNYFLAPWLVIGPYLEPKGITYVHPFCDKRMIDYAFRNVPWNFVYDYVNPYKHFLREAQEGVVPEEVRLRTHDDFCFDGFYYSLLDVNRGFLRELIVNAAKDYPDWIDEKCFLASFEKMLFGSYANSELKLARFIGYLVWKHHFKRYLA